MKEVSFHRWSNFGPSFKLLLPNTTTSTTLLLNILKTMIYDNITIL